jgi:DNA-binding response OmpR family regulator
VDDGEKVAQIMVIDDDPDTVKILAHYLRREGFNPIEATSGAEGCSSSPRIRSTSSCSI